MDPNLALMRCCVFFYHLNLRSAIYFRIHNVFTILSLQIIYFNLNLPLMWKSCKNVVHIIFFSKFRTQIDYKLSCNSKMTCVHIMCHVLTYLEWLYTITQMWLVSKYMSFSYWFFFFILVFLKDIIFLVNCSFGL